MRRLLAPVLLLSLLGGATFALGGDPAGASTDATTRGAAKVKCKKGFVRKRVHGKFVCVKKKEKKTPTATPGLDLLATPGTYKGTNGVTVTSSTTSEGGHQISMRITFPSGYVSCPGHPPYPAVTVSVADMEVSDFGSFAGTSTAGGGYVQIQGHFTAPNALVLDTAGVSNAPVRGQRCAAQYTGASVVF